MLPLDLYFLFFLLEPLDRSHGAQNSDASEHVQSMVNPGISLMAYLNLGIPWKSSRFEDPGRSILFVCWEAFLIFFPVLGRTEKLPKIFQR